MFKILKDSQKKFSASFYVMLIGVVGIVFVTTLRQNHEKKRQQAFLSLFREYEKSSTPELLEELIVKSNHSSQIKKQFGSKLFQEMVLFRPDIFTKAWLKEPIKLKDNYDRFSEGSLLIVQNQLEDALLSGQKLQQEISIKDSPVLYAFNAFRLAILNDKLGHKEEARRQFSSILEQKELKEMLDKAYKFEAVSVCDFIEDRLNSLDEGRTY